MIPREMGQLSFVPTPNDWAATLRGIRNFHADQIVGLNNQTVHDEIVEASIKAAVKELQARYGNEQVLSFEELKENYKTKWEELRQRKHGLSEAEVQVLEKFFDRENSIPDELKDYLNLAWSALKDTHNLISQDSNDAFLSWFKAGPIDAQLAYLLDHLGGKYNDGETYPNKEALFAAIAGGNVELLTRGKPCVGGQLNRLIHGLTLIHVDVTVEPSEGEKINVQKYWLENFAKKSAIQWLAYQHKGNPTLFDTEFSSALFKKAEEQVKQNMNIDPKIKEEEINLLTSEQIKNFIASGLGEVYLLEDSDEKLTAEQVNFILVEKI